jgi:hypothetical protein
VAQSQQNGDHCGRMAARAVEQHHDDVLPPPSVWRYQRGIAVANGVRDDAAWDGVY